MAPQSKSRDGAGNPAGERAVQRTTRTGSEPDNAVTGRHIYGRAIMPVEFFRRMPTGGATAYFKPSQPEA